MYIDLSGWSPKYFPPILVQYANSLPRQKMPFGSDWPMISPGCRPGDSDTISIMDEVPSLILQESPRKLLGG